MTKPKNEESVDGESSNPAFNVGLFDEEKQDLEQMIGEFQQARTSEPADLSSFKKQIEAINQRMDALTAVFQNLDRSIKPLNEVIRLTLEKCELLNQRINSIIDALRSGEPL